jgi:hypothetical protein
LVLEASTGVFVNRDTSVPGKHFAQTTSSTSQPRAALHCKPSDDFEACVMTTVHFSRLDPARTMCRFYRLDMRPDLFGGVLLLK